MTQDARCKNCQGEVESLDHILRRCNPAKTVWEDHKAIGWDREFYNSNFKLWIERNSKLKKKENDRTEWGTLFTITIWGLRKQRNEYVFNNIKYQPKQVSIYNNLASTISKAKDGSHTRITKNPQWVSWRKLPRGI
ncbi:uncharacterized protein LOC120173576 [Hibiscus syriacus]|uniref:uncharacterized protein LOC120173576 n=1 Tax=Hibiscus syriacus TaxID=106335 RepID=UPI0019219D7C|nr:uncharacterized protein LOC120173576 [Hibiscus syriacus]